jgi:hypothetical protein
VALILYGWVSEEIVAGGKQKGVAQGEHWHRLVSCTKISNSIDFQRSTSRFNI